VGPNQTGTPNWRTRTQIARHNEPAEAAGPPHNGESEGLTIERTDLDKIKIWYGIARGEATDRQFPSTNWVATLRSCPSRYRLDPAARASMRIADHV
jgi:hypothetical protein